MTTSTTKPARRWYVTDVAYLHTEEGRETLSQIMDQILMDVAFAVTNQMDGREQPMAMYWFDYLPVVRPFGNAMLDVVEALKITYRAVLDQEPPEDGDVDDVTGLGVHPPLVSLAVRLDWWNSVDRALWERCTRLYASVFREGAVHVTAEYVAAYTGLLADLLRKLQLATRAAQAAHSLDPPAM